MIKEKLLEFQYYLDRLSMFMKESYGITDQTKIFWMQLKQVNDNLDYFFKQLDIWNPNYEIEVQKVLDNIGLIFGCYRNFTILVKTEDPLNPEYYKAIELTNDEFLLYIKCQIVKQNFKGTREELALLYTTFDNLPSSIKLPLNIFYNTIEDNQGLSTLTTCNIFLSNFNDFSENILELFKGGYLTIESMGITYHRVLSNILNIAVFTESGGESETYNYFYGTATEGSQTGNPVGGYFG